MILEVSTASTLGHFEGKIVRPSLRRLTTRQPRVLAAYKKWLQRQYELHRIPERLDKLLAMASVVSPDTLDMEAQNNIQTIYTEMDQYKVNTEANCRKIAKPALPYCPSITFWYNQIHAYRVLL